MRVASSVIFMLACSNMDVIGRMDGITLLRIQSFAASISGMATFTWSLAAKTDILERHLREISSCAALLIFSINYSKDNKEFRENTKSIC